MNCPKCNVPLNPETNTCPQCGTKYEIRQVPVTYVNAMQQQQGQIQARVNNTPNVQTNGPEVKPKENNNTVVIIGIVIFVILVFGLLFAFQAFSNNQIKRIKNGKRTVMIYASPSDYESIASQFSNDINGLKLNGVNFDAVDVLLYVGGTSKWNLSPIDSNENAIYKLTSNGLEKLERYNRTNMSVGLTLLNFLNYVYNNYESEYYDLVLYNHGGGLDGIVFDDFNEGDILTLSEISTVLKNSSFGDTVKIDMVLFRASIMGSLEVANVLEPYVDYLVVSEDSIYMGGSYTNSCLSYIENIDKNSDTIDLAKHFIDDYKSYYENVPNNAELSYSLLDLSNIKELTTKYEEVLKGIELNRYYKKVASLRDEMIGYGNTETGLIDLYSWVNKIKDYSKNSSSELIELIDKTVIYIDKTNDYNHGLSVYFPYKFDKQSENYMEIIKNIRNFEGIFNYLSTYSTVIKNGKSKVITKASLGDSGIYYDSSNEFILELDDEQAEDFSSASYMILKKVDGRYYFPVYYSNKFFLDGNVLKVNITKRIIHLKNVSGNGKSINDSYIYVHESNNNTFEVEGVVSNIDHDLEELPNMNVKFNIIDNKGKLSINNILYSNKNQNGTESNIILDKKIYNYVDFSSPSYYLLDNDGYYTDNYNNENPTSYSYGVEISDLEFEYVDMDLAGEYYCVFEINDIYGNKTYLKSIRIK